VIAICKLIFVDYGVLFQQRLTVVLYTYFVNDVFSD